MNAVALCAQARIVKRYTYAKYVNADSLGFAVGALAVCEDIVNS